MKKIENVSIIGMGALGMLYGNKIARQLGTEQVRYIMDRERFERHSGQRYAVNGAPAQFTIVKAEEAAPCDLLIVAVKYTGLAAALDVMRTSVGDDTIIISVMNGISGEDIIGARYGRNRVIDTVAQGMDAMHFGNELQYTKEGQLCIGITDASMQEKLDALRAFLERVGLAYCVEPDIRLRMWGKFMLNVGINQTCMVYDVGYADAMKEGSAEAMTLIGAMREVILLANAEQVPLTEQDLKQYLELVRTLAPDATPSMGQDRRNQRPSEVELFAGTVLKLAKKHDIAVPANEFLYRRVHEIEALY